MDKKIKEILEDIFNIDQSMKEKEAEIAKIVEELIKAKPIAKIDNEFMNRLRSELISRAVKKKERVAIKNNFSILNFSGKLAYSLMGAFLAVLLLAPIFFFGNVRLSDKSSSPEEIRYKNPALSQSVKKVADSAFGTFLPSEIQKPVSGLGIGGGGGPSVSNASDGVSEKQSAMPVYESVNYRYIYKGKDIASLSGKADVYARIKNEALGKNLAKLLKGANISLLDVSKLQNLNVNNISFSEDRDFGYDVTLSPMDGNIYFYMNWLKWPDPYAACKDITCSENINLKPSDMPEDSEIISIADNFLDAHGIVKSSYGKGQVLKNYLDQYPRPIEGQSQTYVPDNISVIYPLKINGQDVYDTSGELDGMFVDVNIRYKKASGARNIYFQDFQSSGYDVETETKNIISYAEKGGLYGEYVYENPTKTLDVELGDPSLELVKIWKYSEEKKAGEEFYVPSYIFPITNKPEGYFYKKNVIVPAIKDMLNDASGVSYPSGSLIMK